jgi:hypothetical protein
MSGFTSKPPAVLDSARLSSSLGAVVLIVGLGLGVCTVLYPSAAVSMVLIAGIAALILAVRCFLPLAPTSPVYLAAGIYMTVGIIGAVVFTTIVPNAGSRDLAGATTLVQSLPKQLIGPTAGIYLICAAAILAGALLFFLATGARADASVRWSSAVQATSRGEAAILWFGVVPLVLTIIGLTHGVATLLERSEYLEGRSPTAGLGSALGVAAVLGAGYVWASSASTVKRGIAVGVFGVWLCVFFSLASRSLAISFLAFAFGIVLGRPSTGRGRIFLVLTPIAAVAALGLALYLRGSSEHGLIPYLGTVTGNDPSAHFPIPEGIELNPFVSFINTGLPAYLEPKLPFHDLWVSVNPLPGPLSGWHELAPNHRVDVNTPYSAPGELVNYGWVILVAYYMAMGAILAYANVRARALLASGHSVHALAVTGMAALVPVISLQYDLRTVSRLLYYTLTLLLLAYLARVLRGMGPRRHPLDRRAEVLPRP